MNAREENVSVIITAWKESRTVANLVSQFERQLADLGYKFEILLISPDKETAEAGLFASKLKSVTWIQDEKKGKPAALNQGLKKAKGDLLILVDGDVEIGGETTENLLKPFSSTDPVILVSSRPKPINPRNSLFGFWAHLLTEAGAHKKRLIQQNKNGYIDASGYLLAIRKGVVKKVPEEILSDDAYISRIVWNKGGKIYYQPKAEVYVRFPDNLKDWLAQKKRSGGGYVQLEEIIKSKGGKRMRSFGAEVFSLWNALSYARNIKEFFWTILLIIIRLYLWLAIFWERKIVKKSFKDTWVRVESTK